MHDNDDNSNDIDNDNNDNIVFHNIVVVTAAVLFILITV